MSRCAHKGCGVYATHDRFTATGPLIGYCKKHWQIAIILFGRHDPKTDENE